MFRRNKEDIFRKLFNLYKCLIVLISKTVLVQAQTLFLKPTWSFVSLIHKEVYAYTVMLVFREETYDKTINREVLCCRALKFCLSLGKLRS